MLQAWQLSARAVGGRDKEKSSQLWQNYFKAPIVTKLSHKPRTPIQAFSSSKGVLLYHPLVLRGYITVQWAPGGATPILDFDHQA